MYIIDGHNLIPKLPGGSLREVDDEEWLIGLLQGYARGKRRLIEVFFDGAPPGKAGERRYGTVHAHFVTAERTADEAIRRCLVGLKAAARNATVISSDRQVQANARALHARVIPSEDFARELAELADRPEKTPASKRTTAAPAPGKMSEKELGGWLDLFGIDPAQADAPIEPPARERKVGKKRKKKK